MPGPIYDWFGPVWVLMWLSGSGALSLFGGWYELSKRFKSNEAIDGQRFSFGSGLMGSAFFPVSYGGILFVTVGPTGIAFSVLFLFRFLHPRLVIPWSEIDRCEEVERASVGYVQVHVAGSDRRLLLTGAVGKKVCETWAEAQRITV